MSNRWDLAAIRAGAAVTVVFAVPFTLAAVWFGDRDDDQPALVFNLLAMAGFMLGAGCAAWVQRHSLPMSHGLVTAVGTYTAVRSVFIVIDLVQGDDVNWFAAMFALTLALAAGLVGGWLGGRLHAKGFRPSGSVDS